MMTSKTGSYGLALPSRHSQSNRTGSINTADNFERYRLTAETRDGSTLQLVRDSNTGIDAWQTWTRKKHLGRGAFGEVWQEAWEDADGDWHYRAVKVCSERKMKASQVDYKRELSALAAFSKSECAGWFINLHGWWLASGKISVAMEYVSRGDLSRYAATGIPEPEIKEITYDVLQGLQFMHKVGFTHRDIKPQNILVFRKKPEFQRWWVKIADFGISKRILADSETALHSSVGTRPYCAPEILGYIEQHRETSIYSNKVDIWSLGCVVFNLSSRGQLAFSESDLVRYCDGRIDFNARNLPLYVSETGITFIKALLQPQPNIRPTAAEVLIHHWLTSDNAITSSNSGQEPTLRSEPQQNFNSFLNSFSSVADTRMNPDTMQTAIRPVVPEPAEILRAHTSIMGDSSSDLYNQHGRSLEEPATSQSTHRNDNKVKSSQTTTQESTPARVTVPGIHCDDILEQPTEPSTIVTEPGIGTDMVSMRTGIEEEEATFFAWLEKSRNQFDSVQFPTLLHFAAQEGDLNAVIRLKQQGLDINAKNDSGGTVIHYAAQAASVEVIQWLAKEGFDLNTKNNRGVTPLHSATEKRSLKVVQWLVKERVNIDARDDLDYTPLHYAAYYGHLEIVLCLIREGSSIYAKNGRGLTPLHLAAAESNRIEVVQWLVQSGFKAHIKDNDGQTSLHLAAQYCNLDIVRWLVKNGVDVNIRDNVDNTPLHNAAYYGYLELVQWLVQEGAILDARNLMGFTPFHSAVYGRSLRVMGWLFKERVDVLTRRNDGLTVLHTAAQCGHYEIVEWLLNIGFNVNINDHNGDTPLHSAAHDGHLVAVQSLVKEGADINSRNLEGLSARQIAKQRGHERLELWLGEQESAQKASLKPTSRFSKVVAKLKSK